MANPFSPEYQASAVKNDTLSGWVLSEQSRRRRRREFSQSSIFLCFVSFVATKEMKKQFESKQLSLSKVNL